MEVEPCNGPADEQLYPFAVGHHVRWTPEVGPTAPGGPPSEVPPPSVLLLVNLLLSSLDTVGASKAESIGPFLLRCLQRSPQFARGELCIVEAPADESISCVELCLVQRAYAVAPPDAPVYRVVIADDEAGTPHTLYWDDALFGDFCVIGMLASVLYHSPPIRMI